MKALAVIAVFLVSWPALALDVTIGDLTDCTTWLEERDKLETWVHSHSHPPGDRMPWGAHMAGSWLIGFLQGYDYGCLTDKRSADGLDSEAGFKRLDRICRSAEKGTNLHMAAEKLIHLLHPELNSGLA